MPTRRPDCPDGTQRMEASGIRMVVAPKSAHGYDDFAWALLPICRADNARARMAEALALLTLNAKSQ